MENRLTAEERARLAEGCYHLAHWAACRFGKHKAALGEPLDLDELVEAALLAVVNAARSWDPAAGVKFSTYATIGAKMALWECYRQAQRAARRYHSLDRDRGDGPPLAERLVGYREPDPAEAAEGKDLVETLLAALDEDNRDILVRFFFEGQSAEDIGKARGTTKANISERLRRAVGRLRKLVGATGAPPKLERRTPGLGRRLSQQRGRRFPRLSLAGSR
jgi:RNA polymerase sigma factor (sigma-70 family)